MRRAEPCLRTDPQARLARALATADVVDAARVYARTVMVDASLFHTFRIASTVALAEPTKVARARAFAVEDLASELVAAEPRRANEYGVHDRAVRVNVHEDAVEAALSLPPPCRRCSAASISTPSPLPTAPRNCACPATMASTTRARSSEEAQCLEPTGAEYAQPIAHRLGLLAPPLADPRRTRWHSPG